MTPLALVQPPANPAPPNGAAVLAVLERRLKELQARDGELCKLQIKLEKQSREPKPTRDPKAEALLQGSEFAPDAVPAYLVPSQLDNVRAERATISRALDLGYRQHTELMLKRAGDIYAEHFPEIAKLEKERVLAALKLQAVDRARERLRERLVKLGGGNVLPTDGPRLLDLGDLEDDVTWIVNRAIADGIMTKSEIERAKNA